MGLPIGNLNIYHLLEKLPELTLILSQNFHMFGISECWLIDTVSGDEIAINGFKNTKSEPNRKLESAITVYFFFI